MDYFIKNIRVLQKRNKIFAQELKKSSLPENYSVAETKTGDYTVSVTYNEKTVLFHSKYNPEKEAKRAFDSGEKTPQLVIIAGMGLGYYVEQANVKFPGVKIIVLEKNLSLFKLALTLRDLTGILSNEDIEFIITENGDEIVSILQDLQTKNILISIHRPSNEIYPETYSNVKKLVNSFVNSREINIATLARFQKLWTKNILNNAFNFTRYAGIKKLFGKFKNVPVFIVSSGPSLKKNFQELRKVKNKGIIIAVNSALRLLVSKGIIPDIAVAVDPQDKITKFFEGVNSAKTLLVTEVTVSKKIIEKYPGPILFTSSVFKMGKWLEKFSSEKGEIDVGGSVSTAAYGLAKKMGCSPIVFCGLDLAYPGGQTHVPGSYFEDNWLNEADKINTALTLYKKFMRQHELIDVPSYHNQDVMLKTDRKFLMFLWWFENKFKLADFPVIDSTEGGAYKKNTLQMPLATVVRDYLESEIDKKPLQNSFEPDYLKKSKELLDEMQQIMEELERILEKSKEGSKLANELYILLSEHVVHKKTRDNKIDDLLFKLDKIDTEIKNDEKMSGILSLAIQRTINTVTHNFDSNLSETEKEHNELRIARHSIMLYEAVADSCEFNLHHFKKAVKRIKRETEKTKNS